MINTFSGYSASGAIGKGIAKGNKIEEISQNALGITIAQKNYLIEIKLQIDTFLQRLYGLKKMGFHSLKNAEKIANELAKNCKTKKLY